LNDASPNQRVQPTWPWQAAGLAPEIRLRLLTTDSLAEFQGIFASLHISLIISYIKSQ
jgi:hypothetical protein